MTTYYHVSVKDLGPNPILKAKIPETSSIESEGDTSRVCFSKSILGCIWSLNSHYECTIFDYISEFIIYNSDNIKSIIKEHPGFFVYNNPTIYITNKRLLTPPDVSDFRATGEMWSIKDIHVTRLGYLNLRKTLDSSIQELNKEHGVIVNKTIKTSIIFMTEYLLLKNMNKLDSRIKHHKLHKK